MKLFGGQIGCFYSSAPDSSTLFERDNSPSEKIECSPNAIQSFCWRCTEFTRSSLQHRASHLIILFQVFLRLKNYSTVMITYYQCTFCKCTLVISIHHCTLFVTAICTLRYFYTTSTVYIMYNSVSITIPTVHYSSQKCVITVRYNSLIQLNFITTCYNITTLYYRVLHCAVKSNVYTIFYTIK